MNGYGVGAGMEKNSVGFRVSAQPAFLLNFFHFMYDEIIPIHYGKILCQLSQILIMAKHVHRDIGMSLEEASGSVKCFSGNIL